MNLTEFFGERSELIFPVLFYHHSWSLWLGFDFIVESLPKYDGGKGHR